MSWRPNNEMQRIDLSYLGDFHPEEVLYEFDGPCIFTTRSPSKALLIGYLSEDLETDKLLRYVASTTSEETVQALRQGLISIRQALTRGSMWLVDFDYALRPSHAFAVTLDELPNDALPDDGTMLWSHLEPALRVRLEGPEVAPGKIPALVFAHAGEIAAKALKSVFEWAARDLLTETAGRPPDWLRTLYNLPTQRVAYGSLDISFRAPELPRKTLADRPFESLPTAPSAEEIVERGWALLKRGLDWAVSESNAELPESEDESVAILDALRHLAPGASGPVTTVSVTGSKIGSLERPYRLDRTASKKIRASLTALKKRREVQLRVFSGLVRNLDLDRLTFILRAAPGEMPETPFALEDEQLLETIREAFGQELEVLVAARSLDAKTWTAVDVEFASRSPNSKNANHD